MTPGMRYQCPCGHIVDVPPKVRKIRCECGEITFVHWPEHVGVMTDEAFYPSRVTSGRERMVC